MPPIPIQTLIATKQRGFDGADIRYKSEGARAQRCSISRKVCSAWATVTVAKTVTTRVLFAIKTYKLQHFLDPQTVVPPSMISDENGVLQENLSFLLYEQQDSALASWLLSFVSQSVLPQLISMDSSAQIWNTLATIYGSKTTSRLMFYRRALHSQRKGDLLIKDFLMKVKGYCDSLANYGEIFSEHKHVISILNGLSPKYESVVTVITTSQLPSSVQNVTTMLLDAEARIQSAVAKIPYNLL
ncbi:hypothetical protein Gotri_007144 [Gossypium trilobum]|uniref:Uncharacterized protein n=1 Tax=Gossypium trilobum TaxID=34281 RepID=A0A7J9EGM1_9ROSI|nr:hypothetical protein [Gossypium trilobum]